MLLYSNQHDNLMTREQMATLPLPQPQGPRHQPYPFHTFATKVIDTLETYGFDIAKEEYAVTKANDRMFGLLEISNGNPDWRMTVGLRGAHDQAFARALTLGSRVLVCSNLCFHGDFGVFKTKQTKNIAERIEPLIDEAVQGLRGHIADLKLDFNKMQERYILRDVGDQALVNIYRRGGFSPSQLGRAIKEWDDPSFAHGSYTAWRLFNASTQALKPTGTQGDVSLLQARSQVVYKAIQEVLS